jgi:Peptidase family M28/PDZ domain/PA domain
MFRSVVLFRFLFFFLGMCLSVTHGTKGDDATSAAENRIQSAVEYLASDALEGRGVETEGINKAADYIANEFTKLGLKTEIFDKSPFQKFEITIKSELGPEDKNTLAIQGLPMSDGKEPMRQILKLGESFTPMAVGGSGTLQAPVVFVGYGITDKTNNYDDYANVNVKDKIVIIIRKEPQQDDPKSVFNGTNPSQHATFMRKIANASEHGASGVILVNDDFDLANKMTSDKKSWREELDKLAEIRQQLTQPNLATEEEQKLTQEINRLAESIATRGTRLKQGYDELVAFSGAGEESTHRKTPVWFCLRSVIDPLIQQAIGKNLAALEDAIDADLKPRSQELTGWQIMGEANVVQKKAEVKNVVAVLEGTGPLAEETIVVGAHYDHVGWGGAASLAPWTHEIHNGADDNASGTAALLEVAKRLTSGDFKPRRRIVFMAFTAEERGLLGSAYYCRHPRYALDKTIAMFNMDMVGRLNNDKLIVYGTGTAPEFDPWVNELGKKHTFEITKHEGGFGPSDHASFYAQKIPVLHLFTGTHDDYHRPGDDTAKLNVPGIRRVVDLLCDVIYKTNALDTRPAYKEIKKFEHIGDSGGDRPYFGSIPDYSKADAGGLALMGTVPEGPAAKAGLKAEDIIVQFGESKITGIEDFDSALRKFKVGDKVKLKVKRGDKVIDIEVTLGKRSK